MKSRLLRAVFIISLISLSALFGYFASFSYNEALVISRINGQLEMMDASLCSMKNELYNPNPVMIDPINKLLNTTVKGIPQ
jgi:hypothetical protein